MILENGSDQIRTWLDPSRSEWSKELQSLLKPYIGELECYAVSKEVGKVGNNSPTFIIPVASTENKNNIANFFSHAKKVASGSETKDMITADEVQVKKSGSGIVHTDGEKRTTVEQGSTEDNAPLPVPASLAAQITGSKRRREADDESNILLNQLAKREAYASTASAEKPHGRKHRQRSSTSNGTKESPTKLGEGSQRITKYFNK